MVAGLKVDVSKVEGATVVHLEGRLDAVTSPQLDAQLADILGGEKPKVVVDFSQVDYLSSAGMRLLLAATKKVSGSGGTFAITSLGDEVMEIIRMAGFERILRIFPTEKAAIDAIK